MLDEPPCRDKLKHEIGVGLSPKYLALGDVSYLAAGKLHLKLIALLDFISLGAFEEREADVDGVPEEDAGEALGDDAGYARRLDGDGGMLPRGAAAEVGGGDDDVAFFHLSGKFAIYALHTMTRQLPRLRYIEIASGDDGIGINVGPVFVGFALKVQALSPLDCSSGRLFSSAQKMEQMLKLFI